MRGSSQENGSRSKTPKFAAVSPSDRPPSYLSRSQKTIEALPALVAARAKVKWWQSAGVFISCVALGVANGVVIKRLGYAMPNYALFILIFLSFAFVPSLFLPLWYVARKGGGFRSSHVDKEWPMEVKIRRFGFIGLLQALNGFLVMTANPWTPGFMQALLSPLVVPFTMWTSIWYGASFTKMQYLGATVLCVGSVYGPLAYTGPDSEDPNAGLESSSTLYWCIIFALGNIPGAVSSVYQEMVFSDSKVNVLFMLAWSSLFQFIVLFVLSAVVMTFAPGYSWEYDFFRAIDCLGNTLPDEPACNGGAKWMFWSWAVMTATTYLGTLLIKYGGAVLATLAGMITVPLSAYAFVIPLFMGPFAESIPPGTQISLILVCVGMLLYRYGELVTSSVQVDEKAEPFLPGAPKLSPQHEPPQPHVVCMRGGIITSEFTDVKQKDVGVFFQHTRLDSETDQILEAPPKSKMPRRPQFDAVGINDILKI